MHRITILVLSTTLGVVACSSGNASRAKLSATDSLRLDSAMRTIGALRGRYGDPSVAAVGTMERSAIDSTWDAVKRMIAGVSARTSESPAREWLIGDVYEVAYDLDVGAADSTWSRAERSFKRAMTLDSTYAPARLDLARLYINSDPSLAPAAERILRGTTTVPGSPEALDVHQGLAFALYYQGRAREAAEEARAALAAGATNSAMTMMAGRGAATPTR